MLQQQGKSDQGDQAKQELSDRVDPEQHSGVLQKFGLNPQELLSKLGGDIPGLQSISRACPQWSTIRETRAFFRSTTKEITWSEG
jgi:hypothetical protein